MDPSPTPSDPTEAVEAWTHDPSRASLARAEPHGRCPGSGEHSSLVEELGDGAAHRDSQPLVHRTRAPFARCVTSTSRTAGCGPACPVVWEGSSRDHRLPPIPISGVIFFAAPWRRSAVEGPAEFAEPCSVLRVPFAVVAAPCLLRRVCSAEFAPPSSVRRSCRAVVAPPNSMSRVRSVMRGRARTPSGRTAGGRTGDSPRGEPVQVRAGVVIRGQDPWPRFVAEIACRDRRLGCRSGPGRA